MKIRAIATILASTMLLAACGENWTDPNTKKEYGTYGLFNEDTDRNPDVNYKISVGNVVWSIILVETIIMPVYFIGFSLYNPVGLKKCVEPGVVNQKAKC